MASNSTSSSGDAAGDAAVSKTTSFDAGDSCTWYAGQSCSQPRTGYDCLNVLLSTDECAIDPNGACVSMSVYEEYLADREYYEPLSRYFPASNYTYCSANDSVCSTCIAEWTSNYDTTGSTGTKTYCTGSDGCVCVAATEAPDWKQTVIANQCDSSSAGASSSDEFSSGTRICIILALCVGGVMIFSIFAVRRCIRLASRVPGSGSAHHAPSGPQLSLAGWKSLREKLIETEHSFVRGDTTRLDATARSAEALAEAPAVTVECDDDLGSPLETSPGAQARIILALFVGGVVLLSIFVVRRCKLLASPEPDSDHRSSPGTQLSLSGWKSLREKLIETEHKFVKGDTARLGMTARSPESLAETPVTTV
ncbi:uncharacterized protein IUM83_19204 [Phytophthora cinnamomi]|uniref:uncharacterized protein n=1 Tax=Phytophthora cinnamomi TaxID=4785 RepID=UPI0035596FCD|nr:hypothetical protein IUM83_19204 [Phytophthora cinnamomi]